MNAPRFPLNGWAEHLLARLVEPSDIVHHGSLYMRRFRFMFRRFGIRFHHIYREDVDRDLHDHPFTFLSIILSGWYDEERYLDQPGGHRITRRRRFLNFCRAEGLHRIPRLSDTTKGVWTLVVTGPPRRQWGFFVEDPWHGGPSRWVEWTKYVGAQDPENLNQGHAARLR